MRKTTEFATWLGISFALVAVLSMASPPAGAGSAHKTAAPSASPIPASQPATAPAKTAEVYETWPFDAKEAVKRQDDTAKALSVKKEVKIDLGGGVNIEFVLIPAGKYKMGDAPGKDVTIDKPFYMGKYAVTQAQY